ncbi:MAG: membrane protein insertase YidC [Bryobacteraceae bacterium]|jgi:YidC/Oxa1 family membrane protein insertase
MKKEMTMEMRLLLAFLLMGLVIFGTQYFYKPPPQPIPVPVAAKKDVAPDQSNPAQAAVQAAVPAAEMPGQIQSGAEETVTVDTDLYHVTFSNRGAVVRSWMLKAYKDRQGKPLELVNQKALDKVPAPLTLAFKNHPTQTDPNNALFHVDRQDGGLNLLFEYSDGRADFKKSFKFAQDSYLVEVNSQVTANGVLVPHSLEWRGGFGDQTITNPAASEHALYYDLAASKLVINQVKEAKNGPVTSSGTYSFAGLEDNYFAGVFLPGSKSTVEMTTYSDQIPDAAGKEEARVGASVGGDGLNIFSLYVGSKDIDLLRKVDPKLEQLVDWGWFGIIAKPLFLVLNWTADHVAHNYGWAIILVTVTINLILFPLRISSLKSSKKMQALQPQIAAINAKYKNLSLRDPKKAEQNQEVMELYKKHGVNPVGGCLPMVLQIPFLYAFYKVLSVTVEMRGASWLWVPDLTQPETLAIHILPIILVISQFAQQKMTPNPGADQSTQKMMMFMPLLFGYMFYFASAGLVLYWLTGNFVGIIQQWLLNRGGPPPAVVDVKPTPKKKSRN